MGLVSYYIGGTPDLYATQTVHYVDLKMSKYQTEIYEFYEEEERKMEKKKHLVQFHQILKFIKHM